MCLTTVLGLQGATLTLHPFTCQHLDSISRMLQTLISKLVTFSASWGPQIPVHNQETWVDSHSWSRPRVTHRSTEAALRRISVAPSWSFHTHPCLLHAVLLRTPPPPLPPRERLPLHPPPQGKQTVYGLFLSGERESQQGRGPFPLS